MWLVHERMYVYGRLRAYCSFEIRWSMARLGARLEGVRSGADCIARGSSGFSSSYRERIIEILYWRTHFFFVYFYYRLFP